MIVDFVLKGTNKLIMHRDNIEFADDLERARAELKKELSKKGDDRSPAWSWLGCLYVDERKEFVGMDSCNLATCLRQAGATMPIPGARNGKTYKESTQSGLNILGGESLDFTVGGKKIALAPLEALRELGPSRDVFPLHQAAAAKAGFELYVKRVAIGKSKHVRVRPRFNGWEITGAVEVYDTDTLTLEVVEDLFAAAGRKGLGDWRPGGKTPGPFGQFTARLKIR